jgi:hypothetical protein
MGSGALAWAFEMGASLTTELHCPWFLQEGTVDDTLDFTQLLVLMTVMLGCTKLTALRDMSMATWMTMTLGRGDDARLLFLADLLKPMHIRVIGVNFVVGDFFYQLNIYVNNPSATPGSAAHF